MRCERLTMAGGTAPDAAGVAASIRTLVPPPESVRDAVALIIATVRTGGSSSDCPSVVAPFAVIRQQGRRAGRRRASRRLCH